MESNEISREELIFSNPNILDEIGYNLRDYNSLQNLRMLSSSSYRATNTNTYREYMRNLLEVSTKSVDSSMIELLKDVLKLRENNRISFHRLNGNYIVIIRAPVGKYIIFESDASGLSLQPLMTGHSENEVMFNQVVMMEVITSDTINLVFNKDNLNNSLYTWWLAQSYNTFTVSHPNGEVYGISLSVHIKDLRKRLIKEELRKN